MSETGLRPITLPDVLEAMADVAPDRVAVATIDTEYTFAELDERANRLANHLSSMGIVRGDHVAVHARNCIEWVDAFYACPKIGAVPINVNYKYLHDELRHVYDNCDAVAAIVATEFVDAVREVEDRLPDLNPHLLEIGPSYDDLMAASSPERPDVQRSGDDHYIIYTGGTTGLPKGVVWRQEDIVLGAMNAMRYGAPFESVEAVAREGAANENPPVLSTAGPMMHGGSQWILGNAHVAGGTFVLYTEPSYDAAKVLDLVSKRNVNVLTTLGDAMARPLAEALIEHPTHWDLSSLIVIGNGAAPLSGAVRDQLNKALPNILINDSYGSSESGASGTRIDDGGDRSAPKFALGPDLMVVDEDMNPLPVGEVGLLARAGRLPVGYLNDPERNAATFKEYDGRRWSIPGDQARLEEDGTIAVLGRGSLTINSGGEKIHPEEVESALKQHPDVFDAGVIGIEHERWGQQVTALVQLREGATVTEEEMIEHCRTKLARYKAPKTIFVVDHVPRTLVSKVDYTALKKQAIHLSAGD